MILPSAPASLSLPVAQVEAASAEADESAEESVAEESDSVDSGGCISWNRWNVQHDDSYVIFCCLSTWLILALKTLRQDRACLGLE